MGVDVVTDTHDIIQPFVREPMSLTLQPKSKDFCFIISDEGGQKFHHWFYVGSITENKKATPNNYVEQIRHIIMHPEPSH